MGRDNMNASYLLIIDDLDYLSEVESWSYDSPTLWNDDKGRWTRFKFPINIYSLLQN